MLASMPKQRVEFISATPNPDNSGVLDITAEELETIIEANKTLPVMIDVREPDEYTGELGHIDGARLVPLASLPQKVGTLSKDQAIVFVCRSGGRSARATALALETGLSAVYNLKGGMLRWNQLGFDIKK